jgi:restriction endonuclease S subunit
VSNPPVQSTQENDTPWIETVPPDWEIARLGHIGRCANGINISGDAFGSGFPFISYGDVYKHPQLPKSIEGLVQSNSEDRRRYSVKKGDVLFTRTSETIEEIGFSSVCVEDVPNAVFAGFLIRFRPYKKKLIPHFSKYLFRNEALRAFFSKEMMIVTRASLSQGLLQKAPILLPPLTEQKAIADFLDRETTRLNNLIERKRRFVELLEEKQAAQIAYVATKGLNPNADFRHTHVDWIGSIPAHWETRRLGGIFAFRNERNDPIRTEQILSLSIASGVTLYSEDEKVGGNKRKNDLSAYKLAHAGDIVLNSMNVVVGAVGRSQWFGAISPVYYALYPIDKSAHVPYFEKIFLNAGFQRGLLRYGKGILIKLSSTGKLNTIRMKVSPTDLKALDMPVPPPDEQEAIADFLNQETAKFDRLRSKTNESIDRLVEFRDALITAAVTGQIDIASWGKSDQTDRRLDQIEEDMALREARA